jgi:hypothetical protein
MQPALDMLRYQTRRIMRDQSSYVLGKGAGLKFLVAVETRSLCVAGGRRTVRPAAVFYCSGVNLRATPFLGFEEFGLALIPLC